MKRKDMSFLLLLLLILIIYIVTTPRFIYFMKILTKGAPPNGQ